jgi:hypothetical protein
VRDLRKITPSLKPPTEAVPSLLPRFRLDMIYEEQRMFSPPVR